MHAHRNWRLSTRPQHTHLFPLPASKLRLPLRTKPTRTATDRDTLRNSESPVLPSPLRLNRMGLGAEEMAIKRGADKINQCVNRATFWTTCRFCRQSAGSTRRTVGSTGTAKGKQILRGYSSFGNGVAVFTKSESARPTRGSPAGSPAILVPSCIVRGDSGRSSLCCGRSSRSHHRCSFWRMFSVTQRGTASILHLACIFYCPLRVLWGCLRALSQSFPERRFLRGSLASVRQQLPAWVLFSAWDSSLAVIARFH